MDAMVLPIVDSDLDSAGFPAGRSVRTNWIIDQSACSGHMNSSTPRGELRTEKSKKLRAKREIQEQWIQTLVYSI